MFSQKRAVSPLIATVLLLVVTVSIGALVMGIVRGFVSDNKASMEGRAELISCSTNVVLEVLKVDGVPQVCKGTNYADIILENTGNADIDDFQMIVLGDAGVYNNDSVNAGVMVKGATKELNASFNPGTVGNVEQVKFIPKLKKSGAAGYSYCTDVAVRYEGLESC